MFKSIISSLSTKAFVAISNLCILIVSAKFLGVSSRGEISVFILNMAIIQAVCEIYTGYSLIHFLPKLNFKRAVVSGLIIILSISTVINLVLVLSDKFISGYAWISYFVSILIILNTFNCILLLGKEKIKLFNALSILQPILLLIGICVCVLLNLSFTFSAYIYPLCLSFLIASIISGYFVMRQIKETRGEAKKPAHLKSIFFKGFLYQTNFLMFIFCNRYCYYLLSTKAEIGLYSSASMLIESVLIIANGVAPILITRIANRKSTMDEASTTLSLAKLSLMFSLLAVAFLMLIPESIYVVLLGDGFLGIKKLMLIYSPSVVMAGFFLILSAHFSALGKQQVVFVAYFLGFITTILVLPSFIQKFQLEGAAYSSFISYSVILISLTLIFTKRYHITLKRFFDIGADWRNLKKLVR